MDYNPCLEWAYKAHRDYLKGIGVEEEDQEAFLKDEVTVVLLGATQQGKSSLALRLLGAEPDQIPVLDEALSGRDRIVGRSCTRATTILQATGCDDLEKKLDRIAEKVRRNETDANNELHLELPLDGGRTTGIKRVVDLVGLESRTDTEEEQKLAREQTKKWLRIADLKVVVVRASSITDIVIGRYSYAYNTELKELFGYWHVNPHTSFIAITFAWEDTSAYQNAGQELADLLEGSFPPEEIHKRTERFMRDVLRMEFEKETTQETLPEKISLLPLCLASNINLEDCKERLKYEATEISLELIRKRITEEQPLMFRLKSAFDHPRKIEWEIKRDLERLEKKQALLKKEMDEHINEISMEDEKLNLNCDEIQDAESNLQTIQELPERLAICLRNSLCNCDISLPSIEGLREHKGGFLDPHKSNMKKHIMYLWHATLQRTFSKILDSIRDLIESSAVSESDSIPAELRSVLKSNRMRNVMQQQLLYLELSIDQLEMLLPERWHKDDGWPAAQRKLTGLFKRGLNSIEDDLVTQAKNTLEDSQAYAACLQERKRCLRLFQSDSNIEQTEIEQMRLKREESIRNLEAEIAPIENEIEKNRGALNTARRYRHILSDHYHIYWDDRVSALNSETTPTEARIEILCELAQSTVFFKELTAVHSQGV